MTVDLKDLKELAKAATGGSWAVLTKGGTPTDIVQIDAVTEEAISCACTGRPKQNAAFIAAANPKTVLELIARVEAAEGALEKIADPETTVSERCEKTDEMVTFPLDLWWARQIAQTALVEDAWPLTNIRTALEQAKAREAEQHNDIGILIAIINGIEEATGEGPDGEDAVLFSQITAAHNEAIALRNAITAMGGDDA